MRHLSPIRCLVLGGALTLGLAGLAAADGAQAMPVAPALAGASDGALTTVQYLRYPHYRYRRFNRHRRVGLYRCGPGALSTELERNACRG